MGPVSSVCQHIRTPLVCGALALAIGCGARTGQSPPDEDTDTTDTDTTDTEATTDSESDTEDEPRLGSCENPYQLPFANQTVRGRLLGSGEQTGWCSADRNDAGLEDVYVVTANYDVDIVLENRPESELNATLRVYEGDCDGDPVVCTSGLAPGDGHYFYADAGKTYTIVIDSPARTNASYAFDVWFGDPVIEHCQLHETSISQSPGGYFYWENELPRGQGHADGPCGGPGTENMFAINVDYPGLMTAKTTGDVSVDLRKACGGAHSQVCAEQGAGYIEYFFESPGTYYLVVDHESVDINPFYTLSVSFS